MIVAGRLVKAALLSIGLIALVPTQAPALELFGITLFGEDKKKPTEDANTIPAADPLPYTVDLNVAGGDEALTTSLSESSNLIALEDNPPDGVAGLIRRGQSDLDRLVAVLAAKARYGGELSITAAGVSVNSSNAYSRIQAARGGSPIPMQISVTAGPVFTFGSVQLMRADGSPWDGPPISDALSGLKIGNPAYPSLVLAAEKSIIIELRNLGYALAAVPRRKAVVNHQTRAMKVTFFVDTGRQVVFGPVQVNGTKDMDADFIRERADIKPGKLYHPSEVRKARKRVSDLGAFSSVRIRPADKPNPDGSLSTIIDVQERKRRLIGFRAGISNTDGASLGAYWGHRNLFGHADTLRVEAEVSRLGQKGLKDIEASAAITYRRPGAITAKDDLTVDLRAARERPDAYDRNAVAGLITLERRLSENLLVSAGVSSEYARIRDVTGVNKFGLLGLPVMARYDSSDDNFNPTEGIRALILMEPVISVAGTKTRFFKTDISASTYVALDNARRFIMAGRVRVGAITGTSLAKVPANRRFFAGGGNSVRGYAYQSASPRNGAGTIIGGRSLFEASLELRARVTETIGVVPFIDIGAASTSSLPNFNNMFVGAGIGLRYHTPVGPLRFDVAYPFTPTPENDWPISVYVSLGQAF